VLSELDEPAAAVAAALEELAADGAVVALAPADRSTATGLRAVERAVVPPDGPVTVYAPTLRLWPGAAPSDEGWSFDVGRELATPSFQRRLDAAADRGPGDEPGEFVAVDVKFAYAILRTDGRRRVEVRADPGRHARLAESDAHVTDRINVLVTRLSRDLSEGGNPLYRIGDGSQRADHYAVLVRESSLNRALREAAYGAVLSVENGLLLWNDDEAAYNLVVDESSVVDPVG